MARYLRHAERSFGRLRDCGPAMYELAASVPHLPEHHRRRPAGDAQDHPGAHPPDHPRGPLRHKGLRLDRPPGVEHPGRLHPG